MGTFSFGKIGGLMVTPLILYLTLTLSLWFRIDFFQLNLYDAFFSISQLLDLWFVESKGHIRNVISSLICWFLWLERNNSHFNGIDMNHQRIIHKIKDKVIALFSANLLSINNFKKFYYTLSFFGINWELDKGQIRSIFMNWCKPNLNYFKLNVSWVKVGCNYDYAGIIRNHLGLFISGFAGPSFVEDSHMAFFMGVLHGLKLCNSFFIQNIILEAASYFDSY
ncbi:hypothetical protein KFK09_014052 [Dendrobium nobile]|uniref:Uncharacterized protein n=1 Tax=Dendrobium nobile TaxID=94219 RepID=A0A8T3BAM3_DENNO|nr:hypothetical protein KFK09_014052 [Dendrobium nobile]